MTESPAEVERLRARLRELEDQLATRPTAPVAESRSRRDRQRWRSVLVVILVTVGAILAPLTVVATWAHDQIGDTDRFLQTVEPLATKPAVQNAIADRITQEINSAIDVEEITKEALTALSGQAFVPRRAASVLPSLAVPLSGAIENFVHERVGQVVHSDAFAQAWVEATRQAHAQMVAVLTGDTSEAIDISDGAVRINIASFVASVKKILIDDGFSFAARIPEVNASFTIFEATNLGAAQKGFGWLDTLARVLPILTLLLVSVAVMVARNRRKALLAVGLAIFGSMVLLGLVLNLVRPVYLDAIPPDVLPGDAAATIYDQLVSFIRTSLRAVGIVFLAMAVAAFWFAPTGAGAAVRTGAATGLSRLRRRTGVNTGPVGQFLGTYRTFTRAVVVGVGAVAYVGIDHPTADNAVGIILAIVVALVILEFVAGPAEHSEEPAAV
ncbi:MAG: hypothetical protein JWR85_3284 [Marmoricola sp.]|nr:hypothetical protein [Marmoricola sp.]